MLITKFNKMIHNKTLWWFFAITVSICFVWTYSDYSSSGGGCTERVPDAVGTLYGKEISARELDRAMSFTMRLRNYHNQSSEHMKLIRREGWKRLAALKTAETLGVSASINDLTTTIGRDPSFQVNGTFSKERYKTVIESQMQVPVETFEEFLREEIILQKIGNILESCVWTSPLELNQRLTRVTDIFSIQYATFKKDKNTPVVTVTSDDARKYFDKNIEKFRVPEKVSVKFVSFPVSNFLSKIQVTDAEVASYYTNNIEKYTSSDTNNPTATPFEKVKKEIFTSLKNEKALTEAKDVAARFVTMLIPDQKGKAPSFDEAASKKGFIISTSKFFSIKQDVPGLKVNNDFNIAAFDLDPSDPEKYFSDPIAGEDTVYVLASRERQKSHLPDFSNVVNQAISMVKKESEHEAFIKKCTEIRDSAAKTLKSGQTFDKALKNYNASVSTNMTFSAYEAASSPFEYFDVILPKIMSMTKGDITEPLEIDDGMIIVYVADKKPGVAGSAEMLRPEMIGAIDRSLVTALYEDWKEYLLSKAGFMDRKVSATTSEDSEPSNEPKTTGQ
ncbi:MAG: SurA N-terminal domain-containing protein [Kiritimatiellae bacterium]|nr:SurA N-terminal domain-containing protein [Kiritimatiellia bacterium]MDD5521232.1 SurA N-terminal domain-containing protein [Kiritimatiellia bacterium]